MIWLQIIVKFPPIIELLVIIQNYIIVDPFDIRWNMYKQTVIYLHCILSCTIWERAYWAKYFNYKKDRCQKLKIQTRLYNQVVKTLPNSLSLLPKIFCIPILSHSFIHPHTHLYMYEFGAVLKLVNILLLPIYIFL